eukprot:109849-Hanusia_phi.AAC.3
MARCLRIAVLLSACMAEGIAFMMPSAYAASHFLKVKGLRSQTSKRTSLRMASILPEKAIQAVRDWNGAPKESEYVCAASKTDAAVMSEFFSQSMSGGKKDSQVVFVAPNCKSSGSKLQQMADHLKSACGFSDLNVLENAPQPCFTFKRQLGSKSSQSVQSTISEQQVPTIVVTRNLMIYHIDNEEDFVEIGRILLSVKRYTVTPAEHQFELQQAFWKEVSTLVEGGDGNTMIVASNFMVDDPEGFEQFVSKQLSDPLLQWAAEGKELRLQCHHPKGPRQSPWPIIQIYSFDPPPPPSVISPELNEPGMDDVTFDDQLDWGRVSSQDLKNAQTKATSET